MGSFGLYSDARKSINYNSPRSINNLEQDEIIIDGSLLARVFRRQIRGWLWKGPLVFGALLLPAWLLVPRSYTASVSVAMQQPAPSGGLAGLLGGSGGGGNKHYIGVLKSRWMALQVESHVHLQQVYGSKIAPTPAAAAGLLTKGVKPSEDPDGLLYIAVTLPGSPKLSLTPGPRPAQVEDAAAQAANAYALALKNYFVTSDNDQGAVLLRGADAQVHQAKADYNQALAHLRDFSRALARANPRSAGAAPRSGASADTGGTPSADADASTASAGLAALSDQYERVQTDLHAAQAARLTRESGITEQLRNLSRLPTDDPQLSDIRTRVAADKIAYDTASRLYGPENTAVIQAQTRLQADQKQLDLQAQGVRERLTTPDIASDQQIKTLYARQASLSDQIERAARRLGVSRNLSFEKDRLQAEMGFQADILRATLTQAQTIKLNNASAQSRMSVIDEALPPAGGEPTTTRLALLCLLPVLLAFGVAVVLDYLRGARASRAADMPSGPGPLTPPNGSGAKPLGENGSSTKPVGEAGDAAPFVKKR